MTRARCFMGLAGLAAVVAVGCNATVIGGGTSGGGADSTTSGSVYDGAGGGTGGGTAVLPVPPDDGPAIAMLYSQLRGPASGPIGTSGVTSSAAGGPGPDPNTLLIFISDAAQTCANPYAASANCATSYHQVEIRLPPSSQAVGTYPLDQIAGFFDQESGGSSNECSGGGGSYWDGTITITAIDAQKLSFTLKGTDNFFSVPGNADGDYEAERCVF